MSLQAGWDKGGWGPDPDDAAPAPPDSTKVLTGSLSASLVLHGALLGGLALVGFTERDIPANEDQPVRVMTVSLERRVPPPATGSPSEALPPPATTDASTVSDAVTTDREDAASQESPVPDATTSAKETPRENTAGTADPDGSPVDTPAMTPAAIRSVISSYVESRHAVSSRRYVEDCVLYRQRHGPGSGCPDNGLGDISNFDDEREAAANIFAVVTQPTDDARRSARLAEYDKVLVDIMDEDGPAAEQARIRWSLNREYQAYLGGNINRLLIHMSQTAFVNDFSAPFTARPYQFICRKRPCKYRYTGFDAREMGNYVEEPPAFEQTTPFFLHSEQ